MGVIVPAQAVISERKRRHECDENQKGNRAGIAPAIRRSWNLLHEISLRHRSAQCFSLIPAGLRPHGRRGEGGRLATDCGVICLTDNPPDTKRTMWCGAQ